MFGRIANILGWAGVALVLAGVATWLLPRPTLVRAAPGLRRSPAWSASSSTPSASGARSPATFAQAPGALRRARRRSASSSSLGAAGRRRTTWPSRQNKRWDLTASNASSRCRTRRARSSPALKEPLKLIGLRAAPRTCAPFRDRLRRVQLPVEARSRSSTSTRTRSRRWRASTRSRRAARSSSSTRSRVERVTGTSNEQEITNAIIKAVQGQQRKVYFVAGHGENDTGQRRRAHRLQRAPTPRCSATTSRSRRWRCAQQPDGAGRRRGGGRRRPDARLPARRRSTRCAAT